MVQSSAEVQESAHLFANHLQLHTLQVFCRSHNRDKLIDQRELVASSMTSRERSILEPAFVQINSTSSWTWFQPIGIRPIEDYELNRATQNP
jgi:hypothetical protein